MSIQSPVKIEYIVGGTAYELIAVGGWFAEPWKMQGEQNLFESDGYLAADSWFQPLGAATATITFATEQEFVDHVSAQSAFNEPDVFSGASLLAATGTLKVTCGATVKNWSNAVLKSVMPTLPSGPTSVLERAFAFTVPALPV